MRTYPAVNNIGSQFLKLAISALCIVPWSISVNVKPAYGCSCLRPGPPLTALDQATAVFAGEVSAINQTARGFEVSFSVAEVWKGELPQNLVITTGPHSAACGYSFEVGQDYLVYAHGRDNNRLGAGLCSRTALLSNAADDLVELGDGALPAFDKSTDGATPPEVTPSPGCSFLRQSKASG